jgi:hypothetical protein
MVTSKVPGKHADSFFVDADYSIDAFRELVGRTTTFRMRRASSATYRSTTVQALPPSTGIRMLDDNCWVSGHGSWRTVRECLR